MGKGSKRRRQQVDQAVYEENWKNTFGEGIFHRYQMTKHLAEHRGKYKRLAFDRRTNRLLLVEDKEDGA